MLAPLLAGLLSAGVARGLRLEPAAGASAAHGIDALSARDRGRSVPPYKYMRPLPWEELRALVPALESGEYLARPLKELFEGGLASEPAPEYSNVSRLDYLRDECHGKDFQGLSDPWACGPENRWKELSVTVKLASDEELAAALQACRSDEGSAPCTSHSQWAEDAALYSMFFRGHHGGTFVELGALDGKRFSNSLFFEESLGWRGVLIEPSPGQFKQLQENRQAPGISVFHNAACADRSELRFEDCGATGHVKDGTLGSKNCPEALVQCRPLGEMLREAGVQVVDLLSLDVEGYEREVLRSYDWLVPLHVLLVERHPFDREIEQLLLGRGFRYVRELMGSHVFVNSTWSELQMQGQQ